MYEEYYDQFMPSKQMREYLKKTQVNPWQVVNMIYCAPCRLTHKLKALKQLRSQANDLEEAAQRKWFLEEINDDIKNIEEAFHCLELPGIYSIEAGMFSECGCWTDVSLETLCFTFEDALRIIKEREDGLRECDPDGLWWYEVKKWIKNKEGKLDDVCNYVIVRKELQYCELDLTYADEHGINREFMDSANLNLPVPFSIGDIVEIDGFPFGPKIRMLISGVGDNYDCCSLLAIYRKQDGTWDSGAVKHGRIAYDTYPQVSALYTAHLYEGPLPEEERLLLGVKEYLAGDEEMYWKFWDKCLTQHEPVTDAHVREFLKKEGIIV